MQTSSTGFRLPYSRCGKLCGAKGTPIASKNIQCSGEEEEISQCKKEDPDPECQSHLHDALVKCTNNTCPTNIPNGKIRLIGESGAPARDGIGRLEMYYSNHWHTIAKNNFGDGVAAAACRIMG